jgi:hypothetical protein
MLMNLSMLSRFMAEDVVEMSNSIRSHSLRHLVEHLPEQFEDVVSLCKMSEGPHGRNFLATI